MKHITRVYFKGDKEIFHMDYECVDWDSIEEVGKAFGFKFLYATYIDDNKAKTKNTTPETNKTGIIQEVMED